MLQISLLCNWGQYRLSRQRKTVIQVKSCFFPAALFSLGNLAPPGAAHEKPRGTWVRQQLRPAIQAV